jgi:hypothetical protein
MLCLRQAKACLIIGGLVNPREMFRVSYFTGSFL